MAAVALGFSSCSDDTEPCYHAPSTFVLNTPAMQDQYINLTEGDVLELVCSQPDYGYSAVTNYSAEMSLTEDFAETFELNPTVEHQARMSYKQEDVALGICTLLGLESEDQFNELYPNGMDYMPVYFRAVSQLEGVEGSLIKSNVVCYNYLKPYFAVATPGYIWLIGAPQGWNIGGSPEWRLFEPANAIGSKVYVGVFELPAAPMFRFYTEVGNWDANSLGSQVDDNPIDFELVDGSATIAMVNGKGSFNFPAFMGGTVTMTVDLSDPNNMTFTMVEGEHEVVVSQYVYMVGNNGGWATPDETSASIYDPWRLVDAAGSGIYTGTFDFTDFTEADGTLYCRFYQQLAGWGPAQWAARPNDGDNIEVASGVACNTVAGEGCFYMPVNGHKVNIVLDTNLNQVTFTYAD